MSQHHLEKIENEGLVRIYEERLNQVSTFFGKEKGHELPRTLDLEQQSYFAIGYRQMCAKINAVAKMEKKQSETKTMQEE